MSLDADELATGFDFYGISCCAMFEPMEEWVIIKSIDDVTGTHRVEFRKSPDGKLIRYYELKWWDACDEDKGALGDGYWSFNGMSGYFGNLSDCEREARNALGWLGS